MPLPFKAIADDEQVTSISGFHHIHALAPTIWGLTIDELFHALTRQQALGFDVCAYSQAYHLSGMGAQCCARAVIKMLVDLALRSVVGCDRGCGLLAERQTKGEDANQA